MNRYGKEKKPFLFAVNFEMTEGFFITRPLKQKNILFDIKGITNHTPVAKHMPRPVLTYNPLTYADYKEKFDIVYANLRKGNSYLTNLTIRTPIHINLSLQEIFERSSATYKLYIPDRFVCFSPERFVRISGNLISTNPMKGTIDASLPNAEQEILNNPKETAEHNTIVDLLRNDLSIIAGNVQLKRFRYIDHIRTNRKNILQVSSEITGDITHNPDNLGDIIFGMLPAGSVSGAPKKATMESIESAEKEPRGYYTGIFGYFDGKELDTAVMIRFIEKENDNYYFRSGGGITAYSDSISEYNEVMDKIYIPIV